MINKTSETHGRMQKKSQYTIKNEKEEKRAEKDLKKSYLKVLHICWKTLAFRSKKLNRHQKREALELGSGWKLEVSWSI